MNRLIAIGVVSMLLVSCASKPPAATNTPVTPRYTADPGEIPVGVIPEGSLRDAQRNKTIEMAIDYPTRGGASPLIILSHGLGGAPRDYTSYASYWASHGFVVIRPAHADARRTGDATPDTEQLEKQTPADWRERARDISFIIDSLPALEQQYPELQGKINREQIGVVGYSFGAFTTMQVGGMRTFMAGAAPVTYRDPRVKAILALSPQGPGERRGLTNESWKEVTVPAMYMTGSADVGARPEENAEWRRQAFELSPSGDKWFVLLQGAGHSVFTGRSTAPIDTEVPRGGMNMPVDPRYPQSGTVMQQPARTRGAGAFDRDRQLFRTVQAISRAFFDAYLRQTPEAKEYLSKLSVRSDLTVATK